MSNSCFVCQFDESIVLNWMSIFCALLQFQIFESKLAMHYNWYSTLFLSCISTIIMDRIKHRSTATNWKKIVFAHLITNTEYSPGISIKVLLFCCCRPESNTQLTKLTEKKKFMNRNRFVMPCNEPPLRLRRAKIIDFFLSIFAQRQQANDSCHGQNNDQFFWFGFSSIVGPSIVSRAMCNRRSLTHLVQSYTLTKNELPVPMNFYISRIKFNCIDHYHIVFYNSQSNRN